MDLPLLAHGNLVKDIFLDTILPIAFVFGCGLISVIVIWKFMPKQNNKTDRNSKDEKPDS